MVKYRAILVMYRQFHANNRWTTAPFPDFIDAFIETFDTVVVENQKEYDREIESADFVLVTDVGWSAPGLVLDKTVLHLSISGDPWGKPAWYQDFVDRYAIDYVLTPYPSCFRVNCPRVPENKIVSFPWWVRDEVLRIPYSFTGRDEVVVLGTTNPNHVYDMRVWCRKQEGVSTRPFSGVDNRKYVGMDYYRWLSKQEAVVYAMSTKPRFSAVVAKGVEIPASGCLMFAQDIPDLRAMGFNETNCVPYTKDTFVDLVMDYKKDPSKYELRRMRGREMVNDRHLLSSRLQTIVNLINVHKTM